MDEVIENLYWIVNDIEENGHYQIQFYADTIRNAIDRIRREQIKTGKWIVSGEPPIYIIECSECGQRYFHHAATQQAANYCSMCGARMASVLHESVTEG